MPVRVAAGCSALSRTAAMRAPGARRRRDSRSSLGKSAEPLLPEGDLAGENLIACDPLLDLAPFGHAEHPEHILGRDELVVLSLRRPVVGHRSRHSLSLASPRLIQLFIVPSGTPDRSASSS